MLLKLVTGQPADKHVCHDRPVLVFLQVFSSAEIQALTGLFCSASNMCGLTAAYQTHTYVYSTDTDTDMTELSAPERTRSCHNHTNQKQKHPVKGDREPRKVEGGRTASRLMTRGGDFSIKLSLLEWEGYPIAPNRESLIFMPIPS